MDKELAQNILDCVNLGLVYADQPGLVTYCNPAAAKLLNIPRENLLGKHLANYVLTPPFNTSKIKSIAERAIQHLSTPVHNNRGELTGVIVVLSDVTELVRTQQQLISSRDELKIFHEADQLMNSSLELKNILNKLLEIIKRVVDYYCCRIYLFQQLTGELRLEAEYEQQLDSCQQPTEALLAQIFTTGITISQAGELSSLTIPLIRGPEKLGVICIRLANFIEVSENVQRLLMNLADLACLAIKNGQRFQRTHELATIDGLTKLYNRQYFEMIIKREINRSQRFRTNLSMVMVDVNGLKEINDRLGHSVGDEILVQTASILQHAVRSIDYVFRYGGDEMVIVLLDADEQTTSRVVQRIRERETKWNLQREHPLPILSLIIGHAVTTGDKTAEQLLVQADQRMYQDKEEHYRG